MVTLKRPQKYAAKDSLNARPFAKQRRGAGVNDLQRVDSFDRPFKQLKIG
jgi:hypothetical protein